MISQKIKYLNFRRFIRIGLFRTLYLNFKMLPNREAILLPIIVSRHVSFNSLKGKIVLKAKPKTGLITIGFSGDDTIYPGNKFFLKLDGTMIFRGKVNFGVGGVLRVDKLGVLDIGNDLTTGHTVKIICSKHIKIGNTVRIAWESQIMDTNFHYIRNINTREVKDRNGVIVIKNYVWVGNRVTVQKNTVIGENIIVTSNSICNKDYSNISRYSIIGGIPAKLIKSDYERIFDLIEEMEITKNFQI